MNLRDFRIGWRLLIQEPAYSAVVLLGLSIGFATCFLLFSFVRYSWQYNSKIPDVGNVYVVKERYNIDPVAPWSDLAPFLLREAAMKMPGIVDASGFQIGRDLTIRTGDQLHKLYGIPVLPGFAQLLGLQVIEGDIKSALEQPDSFVITQAAAEQTFGTSHALGRTIQTSGKVLRVSAIVRDQPANTTIPFDALIGTSSVLFSDELRNNMLRGGSMGKLLIRVQPGASLSAITENLQKIVDDAPQVWHGSPEMKARLGKRKVMDIKLSPLRDAYFDREVANNPITVPGDRGDPAIVTGLAAIAVLILALAAINYVNLATVRVLQRQREIGMRKAIGATAQQIILQFLCESLVVALLATGLGLLLAWLLLPVFSDLMHRKLEDVFSAANVVAALMIGALVGTLTAVYPTWIAIRVHPLQVLVGRSDTESMRGRQLRRILTVLQITVALSLASVTLAIEWQTNFAIHASPGFVPDQLLIVDLPERMKDSEKPHAFTAALSQQKGIAGIAISTDAVGRSNERWGMDVRREGKASVFLEMKSVSANYFEQYGIKPVAGRLFDARIDKEDDPEPIILNTVATHALGFTSPEAALGQILFYTDFHEKKLTKRIVGIAPELRYLSLHEPPRATAWELYLNGSTLSVRFTGSLNEAEQTVQTLWPTYFPDAIMEMQPAKAILAANYADETRIAKLLAISTGIAMAIAAFGIYALSAYTVQRRTKEIVLRKLYGARQRDIAQLVVKEIGLLTFLAALIGLPFAAVAIERYLAGYVEHAAIGYWTLLFALITAVAIALIATARHAWVAIRMTPALILRT
ncbi:FtsX-like permease family protein [Solimicrobium silvestre]|uniref:FtsX-like permease family n=1 Tax=Solimicrobium silvestre TaxID=2099400 RepID=A0A2S9H4T8_9BURK|nr:FtsX-like permease family protein [Solimicrobium silvestre]PRC94953.1 FtsX-like permease family [Solimicrobium silvestre]